MTLGVLKPYRRLGVATKLLEKVYAMVNKYSSVEQIYLHVQVNNEAAIDFYKKNGFEKIDDVQQNYYEESVQPRDAFILSKSVTKETK